MMKQTNPVFESIDKDKLRRMLAIREEYNAGKLTLEEARRRMRDEVGKVSPEEFAAAEQLVKDEDPDECRNEDVHEIIHIFDGLIDEPRPELPAVRTPDRRISTRGRRNERTAPQRRRAAR